MLSRMYLWSLLGNDIVAGPTAHGVCSDAASAMRIGEPRVKDGSVFLCIVEEVRLRIRYPGLGYYVVGSPAKPGSPASGPGTPDAL